MQPLTQKNIWKNLKPASLVLCDNIAMVNNPEYCISVEEFMVMPDNPRRKYNFDKRVTRGNFVACMIDSFTKSRGMVPAQLTLLRWLRANNGFDYVNTGANYLSAGGSKCLSGVEKDFIWESFNTVIAHRSKSGLMTIFYKDIFIDRQPIGQENLTSERVLSGFDSIIGKEILEFTLEAIPANLLPGMSVRNLLEGLNDYRKTIRVDQIKRVRFQGVIQLQPDVN